MEAVQRNGMVLKLATNFQDEREVVMAAVQQNGRALGYAGALRADPDVACAAIQNTRAALPFVDPSLDKNVQFIECMMEYNLPAERDALKIYSRNHPELKRRIRDRQSLKTVAKTLPDPFKYNVPGFLGGRTRKHRKRTRRR